MRADVVGNDYFVSLFLQKYEKSVEERTTEMLSFQRIKNAQEARSQLW